MNFPISFHTLKKYCSKLSFHIKLCYICVYKPSKNFCQMNILSFFGDFTLKIYILKNSFKGTLKAEYNLPLKYCISIVIAKKKKIVPPPPLA